MEPVIIIARNGNCRVILGSRIERHDFATLSRVIYTVFTDLEVSLP